MPAAVASSSASGLELISSHATQGFLEMQTAFRLKFICVTWIPSIHIFFVDGDDEDNMYRSDLSEP